MPKSIYISKPGELPDYFQIRLHSYFQENHFDYSELNRGLIEKNIEMAHAVFEGHRREGIELYSCIELAQHSLFSNIGESRYMVTYRLLVENFGDVFPMDADSDYWVKMILRGIPDLYRHCEMNYGIGLDLIKVERHWNDLVFKITGYCTAMNLQYYHHNEL